MRVFISYSHRDKDWLSRLQVHLKPIAKVEVWDDSQIKPGSKWRQQIADALDGSDVAILIISADFLASGFIVTNELPPLLRSADKAGTLILPVIASPCLFSYHPELSQFQAVNDPSKPLISLSPGDQETVFRSVAETIYKLSIKLRKKPKAIDSPSISTEIKIESFTDLHTWTRLIKVGDWVYAQEARRIIGEGIHSYLMSRDEYGTTPFFTEGKSGFFRFQPAYSARSRGD